MSMIGSDQDSEGTVAGDSARRAYERIRDGRLQRIRENRGAIAVVATIVIVGGGVAAHGVGIAWWVGALGGLVGVGLLLAPTQRERAWRKGAEGEEAVGHILDRLAGNTLALHDRLIPGSRANIDHILVAPTGVWTIDAKNYTGRLDVRRRGRELWIKGRNRSNLLDQARRQAEVVRTVLVDGGVHSLTVTPTLCFVGVEWPLVFRPDSAGDVQLVSPRRLRRLADGQTVLSISDVQRVAALLARRLRPATGRSDRRRRG